MTIADIEFELDLVFPISYKEFVNSDLYDGYLNDLPFYSHKEDVTGINIIDVTSSLHLSREDCYHFAVVRTFEERCLVINCQGDDDSALYEVNLTDSKKPKLLFESLSDYINESLENRKKKDLVFDKAIRFLQLIPAEKQVVLPSPYESDIKTKIPKLKSGDWKVIRSCIHDKIIGIAAYKYNEKQNKLEIPIFAVSDHPLYEEFNGVKSLLNTLFSACYKLGVSLNLTFREGFKSVNNKNNEQYVIANGKSYIPNEIKEFLRFSGYKINYKLNSLDNDLSIKLYASVLGINKVLIDSVKEKNIPLPSLCYIISNTVWSNEEIAWFTKYASDIKQQLLGEFDISNRFLYLQNIYYSRLPICMSRFKSRLTFDIKQQETENLSKQKFNIINEFRTTFISSDESFQIPWLHDNEKIMVYEGKLKVEFFTSNIQYNDFKMLYNQIKILNSKKLNEVNLLLFTKSHLDYFYEKEFEIKELSKEIKNNSKLFIGFMPFDFKSIDDELTRKWSKCKTVRI